jgi:hypothetical protein
MEELTTLEIAIVMDETSNLLAALTSTFEFLSLNEPEQKYAAGIFILLEYITKTANIKQSEYLERLTEICGFKNPLNKVDNIDFNKARVTVISKPE